MFATMFLLASVFTVVYTSEPECSSFHFLEKTLEKMIKTEIYVNQIKTEMDNTQQSMSEKLNALRTELEETKVTKEDTKSLSDNTKSTGVKQASGVAFLAHDLSSKAFDNGETLIFTTTEFDLGIGYDNTTGIYVTPAAGVYMFNLQLCLGSRSYICFEIDTGSAPLLKGCFYEDKSARLSCHTASTVAALGADENVWIKLVSTSSSSSLSSLYGRYENMRIQSDSSSWNTFSGVLITP